MNKEEILKLKKDVYDLQVEVLKLKNLPKYKIGESVKMNVNSYIIQYYNDCVDSIIKAIKSESRFVNKLIVQNIKQEAKIGFEGNLYISTYYYLYDTKTKEIYENISENEIIAYEEEE